MSRGIIPGLLMVFLVGCNPFHSKKANNGIKQGDGFSESGKDIERYMNSNPMAMVQRDGSFIAEEDSGLLDDFIERFKNTQCAEEWIGFLQRKKFGILVHQMRPSLRSKKRIVNSDGSESYYLPTTIMGYWIELRKFRDRSPSRPGRVEIREYAPVRPSPSLMFKKIYRWRGYTDCKKMLTVKKRKVFPYTKKGGPYLFDDRELRKLVEKGSGIIYLWSPQMPYSTARIKGSENKWGLDALYRIADERNLNVKLLLDPQANVEAAERVAKRLRKRYKKLKDYKIGRGTSIELYMRMMGLHMPTMFFYKDGKIARTHLPGIAGENQIKTYIDEQDKLLSSINIRARYQKEDK